MSERRLLNLGTDTLTRNVIDAESVFTLGIKAICVCPHLQSLFLIKTKLIFYNVVYFIKQSIELMLYKIRFKSL